LQGEKLSVKVYFDLLDQSINDYKMNHALSFTLTQKIREYGWIEMDFTTEVSVKTVLHKYSKVDFN